MRDALVRFLAVAALVFVGDVPLARAEPQLAAEGETVTVTGKLTCTFCKLAHPEKPCSKKGCCVRCIRAGDPPLLTDARGEQYVLLTSRHEAPLMTPARYRMVGQVVRVEGLLVKGHGVRAIKVQTMVRVEELARR